MESNKADGVEPLDDGRILITSWADSSLFGARQGLLTPRWRPASRRPRTSGSKDKTVAVPQLMENRLQLLELP